MFPSGEVRGQTLSMVLINTAKGIAKNTPQIPQTDPKNNIDQVGGILINELGQK